VRNTVQGSNVTGIKCHRDEGYKLLWTEEQSLKHQRGVPLASRYLSISARRKLTSETKTSVKQVTKINNQVCHALLTKICKGTSQANAHEQLFGPEYLQVKFLCNLTVRIDSL
jgi:hypothetical protein